MKEFDADATRDLIVIYDEIAPEPGFAAHTGTGQRQAATTGSVQSPGRWARRVVEDPDRGRPRGEEAAERARRGRKDYVSGALRKAQLAILDEVLDRTAKAVRNGAGRRAPAPAMNEFNRRGLDEAAIRISNRHGNRHRACSSRDELEKEKAMQRTYEIMFIVRPDIEDEDLDKLIAGFEANITNGGGTVKSTEKLGRRKLAYMVKKFNDGNYVLLTIDADGSLVGEIGAPPSRLRAGIKFITVRMDEEEKRRAKIKAIRASRKKLSAQPAAAVPSRWRAGVAAPERQAAGWKPAKRCQRLTFN